MSDAVFMRQALRLARRGRGTTSPNPTVGAVLVKRGKIIGSGRTAPPGGPHAEIEALRDAHKKGEPANGATLYVTLEPCCTQGRTPPCTDAIKAAGIKRVVAGATDPNPRHRGKGFAILKRAGIKIVSFENLPLGKECSRLNENFNHWIVHRTPFVTVKAAMTLDGKIATAAGESKWITGEKARAFGMELRRRNDAILAGINTILTDNPSLTCRRGGNVSSSNLRRIVLDSMARTPLTAKVVSDEFARLTTIVVTRLAPKKRVAALAARANILIAPVCKSKTENQKPAVDLRWLLKRLGAENITGLLVEGGGEVNASFLLGGFAQRVAFFYAPKILGGRASRKGVAGRGVARLRDLIQLQEPEWRRLGEDFFLTARVSSRPLRRLPKPC